MPRLVRGRVPCSRTVASSAARSAGWGRRAPGTPLPRAAVAPAGPGPGWGWRGVRVDPAGTEDEHVRAPQRPAQIGTAARQRAEGLEEREVAEVPLLYLDRQFQQRVPVLDEPAVVEHPDRGVDVTDRYPQRDGQLRNRTTALRQQPQQRLDAAVRVLDDELVPQVVDHP